MYVFSMRHKSYLVVVFGELRGILKCRGFRVSAIGRFGGAFFYVFYEGYSPCILCVVRRYRLMGVGLGPQVPLFVPYISDLSNLVRC